MLLATGIASARDEAPRVPGVLDLTQGDTAARMQELRGEWGFAWGRFLEPQIPVETTAGAPVPGPWSQVTLDGQRVGTDGHATYTMLVRCPLGETLALAVPAQRSAMHLYVNGRLAAAQGEPGSTPSEARPAIGRRAVLTEPFSCPLQIVAHVSNYSHRAGGMVRAPVIGPMELLAPDFKKRLALDTILLGAYLVLSIGPLIFFLARRKDGTPLMVGIFCAAQTIYADITGERLLLQLAGTETPWEIYLRIEYLAWFASMAIFPLMIDRMFPRTLQPWSVRIAVGLCAACALVVALTPARIYTHLVFFGQGIGVVLGLYIIYVMTRVARHGRADAGVVLAGMAFLFLVLVVNLVEIYTGLALRTITAFGQLAFAFSAPAVLLRRLARALTVEELRSTEQREKVDLLVRTTQAGILDWDCTRNVTRYSTRLLEILAYPEDTGTRGWVYFDLVHPADRALVQGLFMNQLRQRNVRNGELRHEPLEYRMLRRDGQPVWVHAEAISLRGSDGRTLRYICSILDITEQRTAAESLKRQNAALAENTRLREDVERMSRHDLKTPLNSIIGVARLLREDPALQPEHRELLAITERAGYRMLEMVNLSLDLSRMEQGTYDFRPQAVNLVDVVSRVMLDLHGLAEAARVHVRQQHAFSRPVYARAEELLCYSILANLLKNAIEATPPGGVVLIGIEPGASVQAWVRNPGQVAQDVAGRFFDKYVTAGKSGGTGLGTYSARMMARVQSGELTMTSGADGTMLTLSLRPLGAEQLPPPSTPASARAVAAPAAVDFPPRRLLIVDDDEYNRLLLLRYLPSPPFSLDTAANGAAAIDAITRNWPDIVLIDMEMPIMNGLEAVGWIRAREQQEGRAPCVVIMMSSNDDPVSIRRGMEAGSNRYLTKPFTREALQAAIQALDTGVAGLPAQVPSQPDAPARADSAPAPLEGVVQVDAELLPEVPAFLESRRKMVEAMRAALQAADREQLRTVSHRAAGGLALFGFQWAAWQSRRISLNALEGDARELADKIEQLAVYLRDVRIE